jgi:microcystin-dependent protein
MAQAFIGEIRMVTFNYAPPGWAFCDGQMIPISQNTPLFSLLGTTYGGNGTTTFALPDFRSRGPIHRGHGNGLSERDMGQRGGREVSQLVSTGAKISQSPTNPFQSCMLPRIHRLAPWRLFWSSTLLSP